MNIEGSELGELGKSVMRAGHAWDRDDLERVLQLMPECARIEIQNGKLCWTDEERMTLVLLLLQNIGLDEVIDTLEPGLVCEVLRDKCKEAE